MEKAAVHQLMFLFATAVIVVVGLAAGLYIILASIRTREWWGLAFGAVELAVALIGTAAIFAGLGR